MREGHAPNDNGDEDMGEVVRREGRGPSAHVHQRIQSDLLGHAVGGDRQLNASLLGPSETENEREGGKCDTGIKMEPTWPC